MVHRHLLPLRIATLGVALLLVGACGNGDRSSADEPTTTSEPAFALKLDAPDKVAAGAAFGFKLIADVSEGDLDVRGAVLRQDGRNVWLLSRYGPVKFPLPENYSEPLNGETGSGPWTRSAPTEIGDYELCVTASASAQTTTTDLHQSTACKAFDVVRAFALALDAPPKVAVGALFDVTFVTDVPAERLTTGKTAILTRDKESVWLLTITGDVAHYPLREDYGPPADGYRGYGPWTFRAPPEPGVYEVCKPAAVWPESGDMSLGYLPACKPIEVTPAVAG